MRKNVFMMLAVMLTVPFTMMAQTRFHDVEVNDAKGPVKSITTTMRGQTRTINFTRNGKQEGLTNAVYDKDGYLQSAKVEAENMSATVKYKWENGRVQSQSMEIMGQTMTTTNTYDAKGNMTGMSMDIGGHPMTIPYTDYKYDARGNWISRKTTLMGEAMENPRTIEYYE